MSQITLDVKGMSCQHCVKAVTQALQNVAGVQEVDVSLDEARATVTGDVDTAQLIDAIVEEGYEATPHTA